MNGILLNTGEGRYWYIDRTVLEILSLLAAVWAEGIAVRGETVETEPWRLNPSTEKLVHQVLHLRSMLKTKRCGKYFTFWL